MRVGLPHVPTRVQGRRLPLDRRARFSSFGSAYERYEADKLAWIVNNPNASSSAYEAAMQAIAKRYGI